MGFPDRRDPCGITQKLEQEIEVSATEKQVQIAAQLYNMRAKAKRLLGEKYKTQMEELGRI